MPHILLLPTSARQRADRQARAADGGDEPSPVGLGMSAHRCRRPIGVAARDRVEDRRVLCLGLLHQRRVRRLEPLQQPDRVCQLDGELVEHAIQSGAVGQSHHGRMEAHVGQRAGDAVGIGLRRRVPRVEGCADPVEIAATGVGACVRAERLQRRSCAPGALLLDSVLSSDGLCPAPTAFLERAAAAIRRAGGLYIADEVQAGFGRTGAQWWGFAHYPVEPDMVVLGKPMGNGMPISAVIGRPDVFDRFGRDVRYFNTFAAGSAAVAAATAVLDELEERDLLASATKVGGRLASELRAITADDPRVAEVRATGLFLAVEIVAPGPDRAADAGLARQIVNGMRDRRVLISASGQNENVLKIRPPLVFAEEHIDRLCAAFADALAATARPA